MIQDCGGGNNLPAMEILVGRMRDLSSRSKCFFLLGMQVFEGSIYEGFRGAFGCRWEGNGVFNLPSRGVNGC